MSEGRRPTGGAGNDAAGSPSDAGAVGREPGTAGGVWTAAIIALAGVVELAWVGALTWTAVELTR